MGHGHEVNRRTVDRLRELTRAMAAGETIGERFGARRVRLNLIPEPYSPELVRKTREVLQISQAHFAKVLNVSKSLVEKWERGDKEPRGAACRLMDEIRADPEAWKRKVLRAMELV